MFHFIDSNSAGLFREWIEQCTQHQRCVRNAWKKHDIGFSINFLVSFPLLVIISDLIRFCVAHFLNVTRSKPKIFHTFFPFCYSIIFGAGTETFLFPLCAFVFPLIMQLDECEITIYWLFFSKPFISSDSFFSTLQMKCCTIIIDP